MNTDYQHLLAAQEAMQLAIKELEALSPKIGFARQVVEISNERRRKALSEVVVKYLTENSAASAEHRARADKEYETKMQVILKETVASEDILTKYAVGKMKFEAARSILSTEKSLISM